MAGTIGAVGNNGTGVVGVNWHVKLMAVKFLDSTGSGTTSGAIRALNYAVQMGAAVSNNSYGGGGFDAAFDQAIAAARDAGHIFVAAAGNSGSNNDASPFYPSNFDEDNVVAVAATDNRDRLAGFSNYGAATVDLGAPGVNIYSTLPNNRYGWMSGTSMATPHVTGAVAMVRGLHPDWSYRQVIDKVLGTADPIGALSGRTLTGGRLDLGRAVTGETTGARVASATMNAMVGAASGTVRLSFSEPILPWSFTTADATLTGPSGAVAVTAVSPVAGTNDQQFDVAFGQVVDGSYSLSVGPEVLDRSGNPMDQNGNGVNDEARADRYVGSFTPSSAPADTLTFTGGGFESPSVGPAGGHSSFAYRPTGSAWTFDGSAGIAADGSGFTARQPRSPRGPAGRLPPEDRHGQPELRRAGRRRRHLPARLQGRPARQLAGQLPGLRRPARRRRGRPLPARRHRLPGPRRRPEPRPPAATP